MNGKDNICFFAEAPLGKLAKWLRILGFDTIYGSNGFQQGYVGIENERRIILTRTSRGKKSKKSDKVIFIEANNPEKQLKEVVRKLCIVPEDLRLFSRCIRCNVQIRSVKKNFVRGRVPDHVWEIHDIFYTCKLCRRIYWPGTHTLRSKEMIQSIFGC